MIGGVHYENFRGIRCSVSKYRAADKFKLDLPDMAEEMNMVKVIGISGSGMIVEKIREVKPCKSYK